MPDPTDPLEYDEEGDDESFTDEDDDLRDLDNEKELDDDGHGGLSPDLPP